MKIKIGVAFGEPQYSANTITKLFKSIPMPSGVKFMSPSKTDLMAFKNVFPITKEKASWDKVTLNISRVEEFKPFSRASQRVSKKVSS